eukprot:PhF_6_TR42839/c0_g1_i1/m.64875
MNNAHPKRDRETSRNHHNPPTATTTTMMATHPNPTTNSPALKKRDSTPPPQLPPHVSRSLFDEGGDLLEEEAVQQPCQPPPHSAPSIDEDEAFARRLMEEELHRAEAEGENMNLELAPEFEESLRQLSPRTRLEVLRDIAQQRQMEQFAQQIQTSVHPPTGGNNIIVEDDDDDDDDDDDQSDSNADNDEDDDPNSTTDGAIPRDVFNMLNGVQDMFQLLIGGQNQNNLTGQQLNIFHALQNLQEVVAQRQLGLTGDIDNYSYEQLLELEDRIGKVNTGLKEKEKSSFITLKAFDAKQQGQENVCTICLDEYEEGCTLGILPCNHGFHKDCVDRWVSENNVCPMCKQDVAKRTKEVEK